MSFEQARGPLVFLKNDENKNSQLWCTSEGMTTIILDSSLFQTPTTYILGKDDPELEKKLQIWLFSKIQLLKW